MRYRNINMLFVMLCLTILLPTVGFCEQSRQVDFGDEILPILRRNCFRCHGTKNQEAGLQLNHRAEATADDSLLVAGDAKASLLIQRLVDSAAGDIMPLDADPLTKKEIRTLSLWIDQGAKWPDEFAEPKHWAYQPIRRPDAAPETGQYDSPIDFFVRQRLQKNNLTPSEPAERARTIRRVSLALTGVPPTPKQIDAYVNDQSPDAYEKVVDRLLKSQRYGERWAVPWLDLARYADSNGFQADQLRDNWAYRDWVIRAFNADMPFDDFVIDQIAGDLRPNATLDQKIATGFHRMTTCNVEAGVHPEANRTNQIVDRVNTTATVFLGTTLECAQCHDHKYDPFTQEDYYKLFAYFNNTPLEVKNTSGVTWDFYGPKMNLPMSESKEAEHRLLTAELEQLETRRKSVAKDSNKGFKKWLAKLKASSADTPTWNNLVPDQFHTTGPETFVIHDDGAVLLSGDVPDTVEHTFTFRGKSGPQQPITAIRIDLLTDASLPNKGPGRGDPKRTNVILSELTCELHTNKESTSIKLSNAVADFSQSGWDVKQAIDGNRKKGWAFSPKFGEPHWASFVLKKPITLDSEDKSFTVTLGQFYGRGRVAGKPRVSVFHGDPDQLKTDTKWIELAKKEELSAADNKKLRAEYDSQNPQLKEMDAEIAKVKKSQQAVKPDSTLVMVEDKPRETFVMIRGEYENLGNQVYAGFPSVLPPADVPRTGDRLELARLLTSPQNPLFARVTVNRWWSELFGIGLVSTPEDFGTQAEAPSHPKVLDWLASEFIDSGWSMKHVHKQIVMSATFRQSARVIRDHHERDPENRLLWRGPRFRLPAESIRDNALAISGLLSAKMFGPPIMPYQPDKIWRSIGRNQPTWKAADNEDRFRRGLYVVWKRAAPYPSFINFDAPDRGACSVKRPRTNTPLQALTMLNDPAYAEMALAMADRVLSNTDLKDDESRIAFALKIAVARKPTTFEVSVLKQLLGAERKVIHADGSGVAARTTVPFESMKLKTANKKELAAWFAISNAILNLDETMSQ